MSARRGMVVGGCMVAVLGGCGGDSPSDEAAAPEPSRCKPAPQRVVKLIADGLTVEPEGSLRNARMVRSGDFEKIYFVSADLQGPGLEGPDDVGTWATNLDALVYSVGGFAKQFSDWIDGGETDAGFSLADDGAEESQECVTP